jgi:hypothetical protein
MIRLTMTLDNLWILTEQRNRWDTLVNNLNMDVVDKATSKLRPKNTNDQYIPNILEFKAFCRLKYVGEG